MKEYKEESEKALVHNILKRPIIISCCVHYNAIHFGIRICNMLCSQLAFHKIVHWHGIRIGGDVSLCMGTNCITDSLQTNTIN